MSGKRSTVLRFKTEPAINETLVEQSSAGMRFSVRARSKISRLRCQDVVYTFEVQKPVIGRTESFNVSPTREAP